MEKKNREQRRREKFGHAGGATKEPWPPSEANPAFGAVLNQKPSSLSLAQRRLKQLSLAGDADAHHAVGRHSNVPAYQKGHPR